MSDGSRRAGAGADRPTRWHLEVPRLHVASGLLPIDRSHLAGDVLAGVTLAALGVPEVLGYAKIAHMPVVTGLYTILLPMAVFAFFGSSRHLVVGADSATAAIVAAGLAPLAAAGSSRYVALAADAAFLAGVMLLVARVVRLGFLADFLSRTVLVGFLTGVGVAVAAGQVAELFGVPPGGHGTVGRLVHDATHIGSLSLATVAVSAAVIVVVLGSGMLTRRLPGALVAVVAAIVTSHLLHLGHHGVALVGRVPRGLPHLGLPHVDRTDLAALVGTAASLFVVILAQSAATSRAYAARYGEAFSEDTDLVGLGLANVAAAVSSTFVVNGSPTKTEMVDRAGGRSQLAQLSTCVMVLVVLIFLTGQLSFLPNAVLAAVVFLIGLELIDVTGMRRIWAVRRDEFVVALLTAAAVVFVGVEQGIILAIVASIVDHLRHSYHPRTTVLVPSRPHHWHSIPVSRDARSAEGLVIYRFGSGLYYANAHRLLEDVDVLTSGSPPLRWLCLDATAIADVDYSAADALRRAHRRLSARGARLVFADVPPYLRAELDRYGLTALVGSSAYYPTAADALEAWEAKGAELSGTPAAPETG